MTPGGYKVWLELFNELDSGKRVGNMSCAIAAAVLGDVLITESRAYIDLIQRSGYAPRSFGNRTSILSHVNTKM